jgi:hypothetical protein
LLRSRDHGAHSETIRNEASHQLRHGIRAGVHNQMRLVGLNSVLAELGAQHSRGACLIVGQHLDGVALRPQLRDRALNRHPSVIDDHGARTHLLHFVQQV